MAQWTHLALHVRKLSECISFYEAYCGLRIVHDRGEGQRRVVWMAEPGANVTLVLFQGGPGRDQAPGDFSHLGFALESRAAVDEIAARAKAASCLAWPVRDEPLPLGYYCGVTDPDGGVVEFSHGQPTIWAGA